MTPYEERVDDRFVLRFSIGDGSHSVVSYGYSIKLTLIDEKNLLLYRNILELGYSVVKRAVKEKPVRGKKESHEVPGLDKKTIRLLSRNFVDHACKIIGEEYREKLKGSMRKLVSKIGKNLTH